MFAVQIIKKSTALSPLKGQRRMNSMFSRSVNFLFKKNLLLTNSISSGGFMAFGDLIIQEFEYRSNKLSERYDWARTRRMFIVGTMMGPLHHWYYIKLDKILPKSDIKTVVKKIMCDQAIASPLTILFFFYGMGILEKKSMEQCTDEIKSKFSMVYVGDCVYWPPIQFLNFYYLPTQYRVFYINIATMVFDVFLSFMKHYDQH